MADVVKLLARSLPSNSFLSPKSTQFSLHLGLGFGFPPPSRCSICPQKQQHIICCVAQVSTGLLWRSHVRFPSFKVHATVAVNEEPKWWERNAGPNMIDIHSTQDFLGALSQAGDKLVIVEFYGTWCGSCRALFPKLCKTAEEHPEILFLKVNFDENKPMCKSLNVKVLPYFHFYRGADGQLESFSCSLAKFQKIKDAIAMHNTDRCSIGPPLGVGDVELLGTKDKPAEATTR